MIRESQCKRFAPVEVVDEVIAMWEDHRKSEAALLPSAARNEHATRH